MTEGCTSQRYSAHNEARVVLKGSAAILTDPQDQPTTRISHISLALLDPWFVISEKIRVTDRNKCVCKNSIGARGSAVG